MRYGKKMRQQRAEATHCYYCGGAFPEKDTRAFRRTFDHVIPRSRKEKGVPCILVIACHICNRRKSNLTADEFAQRHPDRCKAYLARKLDT